MSMKKRLLALLLALCLAVAMLPGAALAAGTPFHDVKPGQWYSDAVSYVYNNGLMSGTGAASFGLNTPTNRGMITTILYSLADKPAVSGSVNFSDVSPNAYYAKAVQWASQEGVIKGLGNNRFGPNNPVSREQLAVMLYSFANYMGADTSKTLDLRHFSDYSRIDSWAIKPMQWAYCMGLLTGKQGNRIDPRGNATRSEVAVILYSFCEKVLGSGEETIYSVTFDHNYPGGPSPVQQVKAGQTVAAPADPTRQGYVFVGWFTAKEGGNPFSFDTAVNANTTVYAHWTPEQGGEIPPTGNVTVRFDYNFEGAPTGQSVLVPVGNKVESVAPPTREGYTFTGWYTQPSGGSLYSFDTAVTVDLTLYAHWTAAQTFQVAFNLNYEGCGPLPAMNVPQGEVCPQLGFDPTRENHLFLGWYTAPDDAGVLYNFDLPVTTNMTLYAHWKYNGPNYAKPYQTTSRIYQYDGSDPLKHFAMMGIPYTQGLVFEYGWGDETEASFNLYGQYEVMTFDVGHVDNGGRSTETLYFYFDGGSTPAFTLELKGNMSTEHVVLNVKNHVNLRIVRKGAGGYKYGMGNMLLLTADEALGQDIITPAIADMKPVNQTNLASGRVMPYQNSSRTYLYDGSDPLNNFRMMGIEYDQGVRFEYGWGDETDVAFNLGGGFDMLTFKVGHVDNGGRAEENLYVWADDELVDTISLIGVMGTSTYSLNVHGVNKLQLIRQGSGGYHYAIADITAYTAEDVQNNGLTVPALSAYDEVHQTNLAEGLVLPYQNSSRTYLYDGSDPINNFFLMNGEKFTQGVRFEYGWGDDTNVNFNLGHGFTTMTFTVGHIDNGGKADETLYIYKDSTLSEADTIHLTGSMVNTPITIDVTGVNNLRIDRKGSGGYAYGIANITVSN